MKITTYPPLLVFFYETHLISHMKNIKKSIKQIDEN